MKKMENKKHLLDKNKNIVGIRIETRQEIFDIPIADVRVNRARVEAIEKASNIHKGSKFIKPSYSMKGYSYNTSMK